MIRTLHNRTSFLLLVILLGVNSFLLVGGSRYSKYNHDDIDVKFINDDDENDPPSTVDLSTSTLSADSKNTYNQEINNEDDGYMAPLHVVPSETEEISPTLSSWNVGKLLFASFIGLAIIATIYFSRGSEQSENIERQKDEISDSVESQETEKEAEELYQAIICEETEENKQVAVAPSLENESITTNRLFKKIIEHYKRKEEEEGLTIEEYHQMLEIQTRYETLVITRENQLEQKRQTNALEGLARTSAEAFVLQRTRIVFDYFERKENFIRYWSVCTLLLVWMLCKLRSLAPRVSIDLSFDSYLPWWIPRAIIPNGSYIIPVIIVVSLILVVMVIFFTQGNTIASVLIFSIAGLLVLWSLDSTTISSGIFCFLRLFISTGIFCVIGGLLFSITYNSKSTGLLSRLWVVIFGIANLLLASYLGYWISITDYPNLPTEMEFIALGYLDTIIKSLDSKL